MSKMSHLRRSCVRANLLGRLGISAIAAVLMTIACSSNPVAPVDTYSRLVVRGDPASAAWPLELRLVVPETVRKGSTITFRLVLTNIGSETIEVNMGGDEFDIVVTRPDQQVIWEYLFGNDLSTSLIMGYLGPGHSWEWEANWNLKDLRGKRIGTGPLQARGVLLGNMTGRGGDLWTEPVGFRVE
jgi:hypothetical protein